MELFFYVFIVSFMFFLLARSAPFILIPEESLIEYDNEKVL